MGRFAAGDAPDIDRLVEETISGVGAEVAALKVPRLAGVVLGGGYGRGEGGVCVKEEGRGKKEEGREKKEEGLFNDLDFFAITEDGASGRDIAAIAAALEPVSRKWTERLGVDVDFTVRTPWRIRHDQERLMIQELLHGYVDVTGRKGDELFSGIERREPSRLPWSEAARLMLNRGMGLLLAMEEGRRKKEEGSPDVGFINRNINKCILGAGDARLIACGRYRWRAEDRAAALRESLYSAAVEWKFRPKAEPVCSWDEARVIWLASYGEVFSAPGDPGESRTFFNALRWLARRRTLGELSTLGLAPEIRVLRRVRTAVLGKQPIAAGLRRDWEIFN